MPRPCARLCLGLACLVLAAPRAGAQADAPDVEVRTAPARWRASFDLVELPGTGDMGLLGVHYDVLAPSERWRWAYGGLGGFGAVTGDQGGFFVGGLTGGVRPELGAGFRLDAGLFVGGGGGASAPQGDGLMLRPHVGVERAFGRLGLRVEAAHVSFPGGDIESTGVSLGLSLAGARAAARATADEPDGGAETTRGASFAPVALAIRPDGGSRRRSGGKYADDLVLVGFELAAAVHEHARVPLELWGAAGGGISGFAAVMSGLELHAALWPGRLDGEVALLVGAGGGGDVDTGGGLLARGAAGLRWHASDDWSLAAGVGRLAAPDGALDGTTLELGLAWSPRTLRPAGGRSRAVAAGEDAALDRWNVHVANKTYFPSGGARKVGGGRYESSLQLLGVGIEHPLGRHLAATGRAFGAWDGDVGGYAEGLFGLALDFAPLPSVEPLGVRVAYEIGAGGGGGMDVGSGLIHQATAGLAWRFCGSARAGVGVGRMAGLGGGSFEATVVQAVLGVDLFRALAR